MKTYSVELRRTSFITVFVEAEDKEQAELLAWKEIEENRTDINDANWETGFIDEVNS